MTSSLKRCEPIFFQFMDWRQSGIDGIERNGIRDVHLSFRDFASLIIMSRIYQHTFHDTFPILQAAIWILSFFLSPAMFS